MSLGKAAASPSPSTHLEFGNPRAALGPGLCFGFWGFLSLLGTLRQRPATGGADFQTFHWHGGLAVLQAEENSLSFFLFFSRTSQILAFGVPQENPDPRHQHRQLQVLLGLFQPPQGGWRG